MRRHHSRIEDSTFALNLAPMLDIIVSITPMLLLSVVFVKINVIETPLPQAVQEAIAKPNDDVTIELKMTHDKGFELMVNDKGQKHSSVVGLHAGKMDLDGLKREAVQVKQKYPHVFRLDLLPDEQINLNEIVSVMDQLRKVGPQESHFAFNDPKTGERVETDLLFPSVILSNVMGE